MPGGASWRRCSRLAACLLHGPKTAAVSSKHLSFPPAIGRRVSRWASVNLIGQSFNHIANESLWIPAAPCWLQNGPLAKGRVLLVRLEQQPLLLDR